MMTIPAIRQGMDFRTRFGVNPSNTKPLTLEEAKTQLPDTLTKAGFPASEVEYCISDPKNNSIQLILSAENEDGRSNIPALVKAIDWVQQRASNVKSAIDEYNPLRHNFTFLGHHVNAYEGIGEFLERGPINSNPDNFWNA